MDSMVDSSCVQKEVADPPPRPYVEGVIFGAHCSTSGGVSMALARAEKIGASSCQVFVKNNMQWFGPPYKPEVLADFHAKRKASTLQSVFGHTGYLINIAAPASDNLTKSIRSLTEEIELAESLGLPFLVLHPGAHLGQGEEKGLAQAIASLNEAFGATPKSKVRIALETTAGQGTCLGANLEHLAKIYEGCKKPKRLALCLDTCHLFAAGHDLRTPKGWDRIIETLDSLVGLDQIVAFHLNDSKSDFGSRVDRHAGIGQGKIGAEAFRHIVRDARFKEIPGCLETPKSEDLHEDIENLAILRKLAGKSR